MLDPRGAAVGARLAGVRRVLGVTGGKGGIGKSFVAATLAWAWARERRRVGLLDLDLTSPSAHVILGFPTGFPAEEFGIDPPVHHGIRTMSIAHFAGERPAPLRGEDVTNAILELLAITRWGDLDTLVIDMPPGLGDAALDTARLLPRAEYLVVATASPVALASVRRALGLLRLVRAPILGVLENMRRRERPDVRDLADRAGLPYLGALPWDEDLEDAWGDLQALARTRAVQDLTALAPALERAQARREPA